MLLDLGQDRQQQVPQGQQHTVIEEQQQLLQGVEELVQGLRELDPLQEDSEAVAKAGKVGGTVGRKEADRGIGVCPGQLQTGLHYGKQVGAPGWQCLLQPVVALQAVGVELGTHFLANRQETRRSKQMASEGGLERAVGPKIMAQESYCKDQKQQD